MVQALDKIEGVDDSAGRINAMHQGIIDRQLQQNYDNQNQNRLLQQNVGNALASENDDMPASQKMALQGGNIDLYGQLQKWSKQASDDELADAQKKHELTANLLANIKTPQQLEMALGVAQNTKAISPDDAAQIRDQAQKFGLEPTLQFHAALVGKQNDAIQAAQAQRQQANKDIGQSFAALSPEDDAAHVQVLRNLAKQGNSQAAQYLTPEGELVPGARASALGQAGLGSDVMRNQAKVDAAATRSAGGGKGGLGAAGNVALQKIAMFENDPDNAGVTIPSDVRQKMISKAGQDYMLQKSDDGKTAVAVSVDARTKTTFDAADRVVKDNQAWNDAHPNDPQRPTEFGAVFRDLKGQNIAQQKADIAAKRLDPNTVAEMSYAREGAKSNVKLDTQINRLASVKDQIQQLRDMAGEEGSPERGTFESAIGPINQNSAKEYWSGSPAVRAMIPAIQSKVKALQDEVAQYVQSGGHGSDTRAKNAFEAVGNLQNARDFPTLTRRLSALEDTLSSIEKTPRINAAGGGKAGTPVQNPFQATSAPASKAPANNWSNASDNDIKKALGLQ